MCCERPIQNAQMAYTVSFLQHVEPNLCPGVRSLHCQLGDKPRVSIDWGLQAMGLRPRDVERATEVTRVLPAEASRPSAHSHAIPRQFLQRQPSCLQTEWLVCLSRWMWHCAGKWKPGREEEGSLLGGLWLFVTSFVRRLNTCRRCPVSFVQKYLVILQETGDVRAGVALLWVRVAPLISAESYCWVLAQGLSNSISTVRLLLHFCKMVSFQIFLVQHTSAYPSNIPVKICCCWEFIWGFCIGLKGSNLVAAA